MATELRRAPRVVLHRAGEEGLREEEAGQPEVLRRAVLEPAREEGEPREQVGHVRAERLERRVGALHPQRGARAQQQRLAERLEIGVHHNDALDGLLDLAERGAHDGREPVEADELLHEHRVHALEVVGRVALHDARHRKRPWHLGLDVARDALDHLVGRRAVASLRPRSVCEVCERAVRRVSGATSGPGAGAGAG